LDWRAAALAFSVKFTNVGIKIAAKIPITAITITNSTIVKPFLFVFLSYPQTFQVTKMSTERA